MIEKDELFAQAEQLTEKYTSEIQRYWKSVIKFLIIPNWRIRNFRRQICFR